MSFIQDLAELFRAMRREWHFIRHMRRGGNPDQLPF